MGAISMNVNPIKAQVAIGSQKSSALSPAHQMMLEMQQGNAPNIGGGSMQILRFSQNNLSFAPLDGIDRVLNWRVKEEGLKTEQNFGHLVDDFKREQMKQVGADSNILQAINRLNEIQ